MGVGAGLPAEYNVSPQKACEYVGISRIGRVLPYRLAWILNEGNRANEGFYGPGFDVPGPALPNPENNYTPYSASAPYCVIEEQYANRLYYYPEPSSITLRLDGPVELRPAKVGGTSSITLVASTKSNGAPKAGVALGLTVDVTANSGGHEHHDVSRPKGTLSVTQGITDANGEVKVTFAATEIAGTHTIKATCTVCSNSPVNKEVQVKVPDLLPISPKPPQNADGTFVYAMTSVDITHQGNGRYHHNQYYLTEQSQINLQSMIAALAAEGWGTVALNDASLYWGGRYDIAANWGGSHKEHRQGREIDVSFNRAGNPISANKQKVFYDKFCKNYKVSFPFSILHHYVAKPHFHVYLEKQTACWITAN